MVDPAGLAAQVIRNFFGRDAERIRLNVVGDPPDVQLDEARIVLLLKNLLSNALRYTHEDAGPVTLTVESNSGMLTYAVSDHGPGIAPENVAHLGEPFWRGDPSRTRGTGGSGLGLYLAKLVSIAHGGRLELDTAYTGGARFVVHLPA
jgi:signal transduction histidine kinase